MKHPSILPITTLLLSAALSAQPASDDTLDWLLKQPTTQPAAPATQPASRPFASKTNPDARPGKVLFSNNQTLPGQLSTTPEKPLRLFDDKTSEYRDVPLSLVKSLQAIVLWERNQEEWHFKDSGSDVKEFTGKTYPARELQYKITLLNDQTLTGSIVSPLYLSANDKLQTLVLHKRQKGDVGQTLKDLPYIKRVDFD
jgi:hypothetical protein